MWDTELWQRSRRYGLLLCFPSAKAYRGIHLTSFSFNHPKRGTQKDTTLGWPSLDMIPASYHFFDREVQSSVNYTKCGQYAAACWHISVGVCWRPVICINANSSQVHRIIIRNTYNNYKEHLYVIYIFIVTAAASIGLSITPNCEYHRRMTFFLSPFLPPSLTSLDEREGGVEGGGRQGITKGGRKGGRGITNDIF